MKNKEIWKDIPGFESKYQCSTLGRFKRLRRLVENRTTNIYWLKEKILSPCHESNGYLQISLMYRKKPKLFLAHRLIIKTFKKKERGRFFVNHINGVKDDKILSNLEWCTKSENAKHSFQIGVQCNKGESHPQAKLTNNLIKEIRNKYVPHIYSSRKIAREYNLSKSHVLAIVNHKSWAHL